MGGKALVPARPQRMVAGGGGLQRGRTGTRLDRTHSFELDNYHGEKDATKMPLKMENMLKLW
jgi:hypothetical protein